MKTIQGKVESGLGDFGVWIKRLHEHYERKTGMKLFPGTLNIKCPEVWTLPPNCIRLEAEEYGGIVSVSMVPCRIFGRKAFILRTDANENGTGDHSRRVIEIATDVKLRDVYHLKDGDSVEIELDL